MEKGYSGLRRTRKRAHSSKCPCCYSSEEEPENHASAKKEKLKEGTPNNGKRTSTRKKTKIVEDDCNNIKDVNEDSVSLDESVSKTPKGSKLKKTTSPERSKRNAIKRKTETSDALNGEASNVEKKQRNKAAKAPVQKKKVKTALSTSKNELNESKASTEKTLSHQSQPRLAKLRNSDAKQSGVGEADKINPEVKEKSVNTKQNVSKPKTAMSSRNSGTQKSNSKDVAGRNAVVAKEKSLSDVKRSGTKVSKSGHGKVTKNKGKNSSSVDFLSGSSHELNKGEEHISLISRKRPKYNTSSSSSLSAKKIDVFDHLFSELKKCPGFSKVTVSSAAELLLKLTADNLTILVHGRSSKSTKRKAASSKLAGDNVLPSPEKPRTSSSVSEPKRMCTNSEQSQSPSSSSLEKTRSGKSEQVKLSQAAEALVSFRTNPTILRQEKTESDILSVGFTDVAATDTGVNAEKNSAPKESYTTDNIVDTNVQILTTANGVRVSQPSNSSYVSAPSQSQAASQLQSSRVVQEPLHQPFRLPANIEASLQHVASVPHNLMNLSQLTSQLSAVQTAVPPQITPRLTAPSSLNPSSAIMSSRMMNPAEVQNIQALFCRSGQPRNIQASMAVQSAAPSLPPSSNNPQAQPQQPLKGMEDVVSCVGSRTTANLLWNIKPAAPVVYLTSPQTLSGVRARNYIPQSEGHSPVPLTTGMASVQSVGIPKVSMNSASSSVLTLGKVTLVSQAVPLSTSQAVSISSQRPILPCEQRTAPVFPSGNQSASQLPVTTIMGQIASNMQAIRPGNIPVQFSGLAATSPPNMRQTSAMAVTQAPHVTTTVQSTATVNSAVAIAPVSAKQAVKKFVHERTKSAELKRTGSVNNLLLTEPAASTMVTAVLTQSGNIMPSHCSLSQANQPINQPEKQSIGKQSDFNLHQAASALLSISSQDGLDTADTLQAGGEGEDSLDEHDDEVVFTSKGVFRVGDVDVDPKYNRIGREGYTCGKCGKIFTSLSYLARHIKRVCPDMSCRKWKCTMCDKAFRHPFGLQQHIYTHTGERPHKCSQCPKAFYSSNDLRRHSRIHSGERPYHCKHCEKSFATTISLKTHTYIHTGEKPHKCPHCPKTFATSSKLGRHIVTHSEQRPFACDHCPKSFNRSGDLRRHNMHVHESRDKQFDFDDSGAIQFNTNSNGETPKDQGIIRGQTHRCSECEEVCNSSAELGRHMLLHDSSVTSGYSASILNHITSEKPSQEAENLVESTESGSGDSN